MIVGLLTSSASSAPSSAPPGRRPLIPLPCVRQVTWDFSLGRRCAHLFYRAAGAVLDSLPAGHLGSNTLELYASISCPALKGQLKQKAHIKIFKGTVIQITKR